MSNLDFLDPGSTVMLYVEYYALLRLQKLARVPLKNRFRLAIINVHYRPGSKKSKFDMTLIGHSPFKFETKIWLNVY